MLGFLKKKTRLLNRRGARKRSTEELSEGDRKIKLSEGQKKKLKKFEKTVDIALLEV